MTGTKDMKSIKPNKILLGLGISALSTLTFSTVAETNGLVKVETAETEASALPVNSLGVMDLLQNSKPLHDHLK